MKQLKMKLLENYPNDLPHPRYETEGASGIDLRAAISSVHQIPPHSKQTIPTGVVVAIPEGCEGQVRPRSGLARKFGITVLNTPGTIDVDYRGEISVILYNGSNGFVQVEPGSRIAQLVICPVERVSIETVDELDDTNRGDGAV